MDAFILEIAKKRKHHVVQELGVDVRLHIRAMSLSEPLHGFDIQPCPQIHVHIILLSISLWVDDDRYKVWHEEQMRAVGMLLLDLEPPEMNQLLGNPSSFLFRTGGDVKIHVDVARSFLGDISVKAVLDQDPPKELERTDERPLSQRRRY